MVSCGNSRYRAILAMVGFRPSRNAKNHGAVDDDQLKVFSEATVRKAVDVHHTQRCNERAPIDNPQFAVFYTMRQATNMVFCNAFGH